MLQRRVLRTVTCLALGAGLMTGGCASSSPFGKASDFDRTFISAAQTWDLDKNGSVSCDEWAQYVAQSFREADVNGDGALDAEEWKKLVANDRLFEVANLSYYDANGDGRVTVEEMTGKQNIAFKLLDRNGDCQIDRTEAVQVHGVDKVKAKEIDQTIPGR
ncbi:EF-hand domain-containing protein [Hyphomicrobium sp.]|uniref:EF-hand domain-containing protein n=1 Tax=Hyphomicrobium sp. TaxID=82 RepID=UPI002E36C0A9|nr:EF-hand domain-containing protein [Hyphomicrobium sp.]HEX2840637.1 EF-hand domain-containing protein [Hyphomicrobium sp.]